MDEIETGGAVQVEPSTAEAAPVTELPAVAAEAPTEAEPSASAKPAPESEDAVAEPMPWGDHPNPLLWLYEHVQAEVRRMHKKFG